MFWKLNAYKFWGSEFPSLFCNHKSFCEKFKGNIFTLVLLSLLNFISLSNLAKLQGLLLSRPLTLNGNWNPLLQAKLVYLLQCLLSMHTHFKVQIFWEATEIFENSLFLLNITWENKKLCIFSNFCGLLRIYKL